jgi:DNA-directed RNA polymerase specialized sigma24 family protein
MSNLTPSSHDEFTTRKTHVDGLRENKYWREVVERYTPYLVTAARFRFGVSPHDADDLVANVWVRLWERFTADKKEPFCCREGIPSFRPYLMRTLHTAFVDEFRKKRRWVLASDLGTDAWSSLEPAYERDDDHDYLYTLFADREKLMSVLSKFWGTRMTETDLRRIEFFCLVYQDGMSKEAAGNSKNVGFPHDSQWNAAIVKVSRALMSAIRGRQSDQ